MSKLLIESLGVYLPERSISTKQVLEACKNKIRYPLERLTGIENRPVAGENEFSIHLARKAIEICLERSSHQPGDIDLLICCNISRYDKPYSVTYEPSTAVQLKKDFGIENALCFDISNACAGMFTAIHIVDAYIRAGISQCALVVSGEYITHLTETAQKMVTDNKDDKLLACLTLGDSGVAIIFEETSSAEVGLHEIDMLTLGKYRDLCVAKGNTQGKGGYVMNTQSAKLHEVAIRESVKLMGNKLKSSIVNQPIDHFVFHQTAQSAAPKYAEGINKILGKNLCNSQNNIVNVKHRGNTSSTAHFVAIWDKIHDGVINSKDTVFFGIQASGLTLGVAQYTFDNLPDRIRNGDSRLALEKNSICREKQDESRIGLSALGVSLHTEETLADSFALAVNAIRSCLKGLNYSQQEVGLLIHTGVYRNEFISEPAIAAILAGEMELNSEAEADFGNKLFAYDLADGACGFLNACQNAQAMILSGKVDKVLCVSSEIEYNKYRAAHDKLGLKESGCAALLENSGERGFMRFLFKQFPEFQNTFRTEIYAEHGEPILRISRKEDMETLILERAEMVIEELLAEERLSIDKIKVILPPQISECFVKRFAAQLNLSTLKVVNLNDNRNYHTCSTVFGLKYAIDNGIVQAGDLGILMEAGSGFQIASALYRF